MFIHKGMEEEYMPINLMLQPLVQLNSQPSQLNSNLQPINGMNVNCVAMPVSQRNYCLFNQTKVDFFVKQKEAGLPYLKEVLKHSNNEAQITETLYILNRNAITG